jgi:hypothetical protein
MIEIKEDERQLGLGNASLLIDTKLIEKFDSEKELRYQAWITSKGKLLAIEDEFLSSIILKYTAKDLLEAGINKTSLRLNSLKLFSGIPIRSEYNSRRKVVKIQWKEGDYTIPYCYFFFDFDYQKWSKPYSYNVYKSRLSEQTKQLLKERSKNVLFSSTINRSNDSVRFNLDENLLINEQIYDFAKILNEANQRTLKKLEIENKTNSIQQFDFPLEVRTSCEQYLMFFADFLKEVGVTAIANIQHDRAGRTLFSVKTDNPKIALDAIREALEIYLELPMSPLVEETKITDSRMLVLRAEINTLKARLDYAQMRQLEIEKRADLQRELIEAQKESLREKDNQVQYLQKYEPRHFESSIVYESVIETNYVDIEIVEEMNAEKLTETSNKEIDLGLVTVKPAKIGLGVEANTPRLTRLGIRKGKELFDYLDKKFNSVEEK